MTYAGYVKNGTVVLDEPVPLPEGTRVHVVLPQASDAELDQATPTLYERLEPFIGIGDDLPPDGSINLDHYLYGAPKT